MDYSLGQRLRELPGPLLLTGHTGFKGTWMTYLLEFLRVPVIGYSLPGEIDSLYDRAERTGAIPELYADIRDYEALEKFVDSHRPSTIIHMAAQPLVLKSYESPRETFDVNVMGTVNVLDIAFKKEFVKAIIVVTTDKVYRNDNSGRAFVESDPLEGKDPYSASKVGTEAVVAAWQQISKVSKGPNLVSVRAGNVIGGGDFAQNRLLPDVIRSVFGGESAEIRNPNSKRPWMHVLEPLVGYLNALEFCLDGKEIKSVNFGPSEVNLSVQEILEYIELIFPKMWQKISLAENDGKNEYLESILLSLNSELARTKLGWKNSLEQKKALQLTIDWWIKVEKQKLNVSDVTRSQISQYLEN